MRVRAILEFGLGPSSFLGFGLHRFTHVLVRREHFWGQPPQHNFTHVQVLWKNGAQKIRIWPRKSVESGGLVGFDLTVLCAAFQATDTAASSLGHCNPGGRNSDPLQEGEGSGDAKLPQESGK